MATKMVTDKSADASFLNAAADTFLREVSPAIDGALSPFLSEGESAPDLTLLPVLAVRRVNWRLEGLIEADKANIDARAALLEPRLQRDDAFESLNSKVYEIRDLSRGLYGRKLTARIVPDDRRIPQRPKGLLHYADHVLQRLRKSEPTLPRKSLAGVAIEPGKLASNLEPAVDELREALDELDLKNRESQIAQAAKDEAMADFNADYAASIRLLVGLAVLAGKRDLADRIRPKRRRRTSSDDKKPSDETPAAEPDAPSEA